MPFKFRDICDEWSELESIRHEITDKENFHKIFKDIRSDDETKFFIPNPFSLVVREDTLMIKIHFLFMKLGLEIIYMENLEG